jgi:PEP-CTERM motif
MKITSRFIWTLLAVGVLAVTASANSVAISGGGFAQAEEAGFSFGGPGVDVSVIDNLGPSTVGGCYIGSVCDLTLSIESAGVAAGSTFGDFSGLPANFITGDLTFFGGTVIPASYQLYSSINMPVVVAGIIQGYEFSDCPGSCFPGGLVWTLDVTGVGQATFGSETSGPPGVVVFTEVDYSFSGTATPTPTPEPSTLLLLGTGLFVAVWFTSRKLTRAARLTVGRRGSHH